MATAPPGDSDAGDKKMTMDARTLNGAGDSTTTMLCQPRWKWIHKEHGGQQEAMIFPIMMGNVLGNYNFGHFPNIHFRALLR